MGSGRWGRAFWTLWASSGLSNLADGIVAASFPLLAASLTRDPQLVAGVTVMRTLPFLLFGLAAGAIADRMDRRRLMVITDVARALLVGALAASLAADVQNLALVYAVVFVSGCFETLFDTAVPSLLPAVVERDRLESANGFLQSAERLANEFVGPIAGAAMFGVLVYAPFAAYSVVLALSGVGLLLIKASFAPPQTGRSFREDVGEGIAWVRRHQLLRWLSIDIAIIAFTDSAWFSLLVLYVTRVLSLDAGVYGFFLAAGAGGSIVGSLAAPWISRRIGAGSALLASLVFLALSQLGIGLTSSPALAAPLLATSGAAFMVWNVVSVSLRQALTPDRLLGRVTSLYRLMGLGAMPLGALAGGALGNAFGIRTPFLAGAPVLILAALGTARFIGNKAISREKQDWGLEGSGSG
jgi:MFS family permease